MSASHPTRHRSLAAPLALAYAALVLYASLYPFEGWRWPPGQALGTLLELPWPPYTSEFDAAANLIGYVPLGALLAIASRRGGVRPLPALALAVLGAALLSYTAEVLQQFMPTRVPSSKDFALNAGGALLGALAAAAAYALGTVDRWHALRERWFVRDSAGALALLALWPVALLFPSPVPLALGQIGPRLREEVLDVLAGVPWAEPLHAALMQPGPAVPPLSAVAEVSLTAAGLLLPILLAYGVVPTVWRRLLAAAGAAALSVATLTVATGLNFGPPHALAWAGPNTQVALAVGFVAAGLLALLPTRLVVAVALMVATGLVAGVAHAPTDPYFAQSLQAWEQGRFVRFHGAAQWVGWLWPYLAIAWLLSRVGSRAGRPWGRT